MKITTKLLAMTFSLCLCILSGCVSLPTELVTQTITSEELSGHVEFLTQPALKGRPAGSWESKHVRKYLSQRLQAYGCEPWAGNDTFELDFGFGKNIIGVLPGSDPELSKEIVLISAHFDHLKPKWFSYYPGAADNAAAVAVLLEIAEKISRAEQKPKRTVCFAFFDAEEMFCVGSFAFTCRDDYDNSKIVATINMDLLGRDLLDVVDRCLIVTGTENYAAIQENVSAACAQSNLKFIPLQTELIGPVGDHMAFVSSGRPVLFFTCGINKDYHQSTDTADKLNFSKLERESAVVENTLLALANADSALLTRSPAPITRQRVDSFSYILDKFKENQDVFKLDPNDLKILDEIIESTKQVDPNTASNAELVCLERDALGKLIKLLKNYDKRLSQFSQGFVEISRLYSINPKEVTGAYREMIQHYQTHKPTLFGKNEYTYHKNLPVTKKSWGLTKINDDEYIFGFVDIEIAFKNQLQILTGNSCQISLNYKHTAYKGFLCNIIDSAFLQKTCNLKNFSSEGYGKFRSVDTKLNPNLKNNLAKRKRDLWAAFLRTIEQEFPEVMSDPGFDKYKDPNLMPASPLSKSDPNQYIWSIFLTPDDVVKKTDKQDNKELERLSIQTLNTSGYVKDRVDAVVFLADLKTPNSLSAIVDVMDDETPYKIMPRLISNNNYPLRYHPIVSDYLLQEKEDLKKYKDKTLGQIAHEKLKEVTKKDFGKDKKAWKQWIEKKYPE